MTKKYDWSEADTLLGTMIDKEIGELFSIPVGTVAARRNRKGIPAFRKRKLKQEHSDMVISESTKEIAEKLDVSQRTASRWKKELGTPSRRKPVGWKHRELDAHFTSEYLGKRGIAFERNVVTAFGNADLVTDTAVYELKPLLSNSEAHKAVGQLLLYNHV